MDKNKAPKGKKIKNQLYYIINFLLNKGEKTLETINDKGFSRLHFDLFKNGMMLSLIHGYPGITLYANDDEGNEYVSVLYNTDWIGDESEKIIEIAEKMEVLKKEISITRIKTYKSCLRKYDLRYNWLLEEENPVPALKTGKSYHEKLDEIIKTGNFTETGDVTDIMARAWKERIYPNLNLTTSEERFSIPITEGMNLMGFIDGLTADGIPVEHKTVGKPIDDKYKYNLAFDDQITAYMIASGVNEMIYTVCQKPSIRQRKNESKEEFEKRLLEWYEDPKHLTYFKVTRSREELEEKESEFGKIALEMLSRSFYYPNPLACQILGCPYKDICLDYDPLIDGLPLGFKQRSNS